MMNQELLTTPFPTVDRTLLNRKFQFTAWAIFVMMTFLIWWSVDGWIGYSFWFLGTGMILLGVNVARALVDIALGGASLVGGVVALGVGLSLLLGTGPLLPVLLLLMGFFLLVWL